MRRGVTKVLEARPPSVPEPSDQEFLDGLRARSPEAFETLMDRYEAPLFRFFYYSHGNRELAEDQCAETFSNLIAAIAKMRSGAERLQGFVFGVARNVMRRGWRERRAVPVPVEILDRTADTRPLAFQEVAGREELNRALDAIRSLSDPARQIMLLRFVEELPLQAIADAMKLPVGTVKSHIHRSRMKLRKILDQP